VHAISLALLGVLTATALGASAAHSSGAARQLFTLTASPPSQSILAGTTASFQITIRRNPFVGHISFSVSGLPTHAPYRLRFRTASQTQAVLTVVTGVLTPAGKYRVRLRGSGGGHTAAIGLTLTVTKPSSVRFAISGSVTGLQPGVPHPLDLSVHNPNRAAIVITSLTVAVRSVSAPRATPALPCTSADFAVQQFAGTYPLLVPSSSTYTLSGMAIPPEALPQAVLLQRSLNQDGCQGATVTLAYSGNAVVL
jgi:hypothetical protein